MKKKRILAMLMACFMVLTTVPYAVSAEETAACSHPEWTESVVKAANCENGVAGIKKLTCKACKTNKFEAIPAAHTEPEEGVTVVPATCNTAGSKTYECEVCGREVTVETEPATGQHTKAATSEAATCTKAAQAGEWCSVCHVMLTPMADKGTPLGHDYEVVTDQAATCTQEGVKVSVCKRENCGDEKTEESKKLDHVWNVSYQAADCENNAKDIEVCSNCAVTGQVVDLFLVTGSEDEKALGHAFSDPAYMENDVHGGSCTRCGEESTGACVYAEVSRSAATCASPEYVTVKCGVCKHQKTTTGAAADPDQHVYKDVVVKAKTCTTNGIGKEVCQYCGHVKGYKVLIAGHHFPEVSGDAIIVPATCEAAGLAVVTCDGCGVVTESLIDAKGHGDTHEVKVEVTCVTDGSVKTICDDCGKVMSEKITPATGKHTKGEATNVAVTCTKPAQAGFVCTVCGNAYDLKDVAGSTAAGHTWNQTPTTNEAATCSTPSSVWVECVSCDAVQEVSKEAAYGHIRKEMFVDASCTHAALNVTICSECGVEIEKPVDLYEALGREEDKQKNHSFTGPITSNNNGTHKQGCSTCNKQIESECDYNVTTVAATCVSGEGVKSVCKKCSYEKIEITGTQTDAKNHIGEWVDVKPASCGAATTGIAKRTCTGCGTVEYKVTNYEHTYCEATGAAVTVQPTCVTDGAAVVTCEACDAATEAAVIPALNHPDKKTTRVEPTCATPGSITVHCNTCNEDIEKTVLPATGEHDWSAEEDIIEGTCVEPTKMGKVCQTCGTVDEATVVPIEGMEAPGHSWGLKSVSCEAATCTHDAVEVSECAVCHETNTVTKEGTQKAHTEGAAETKDATCTQNAVSVVKCSVCNSEISSADLYVKGGSKDPSLKAQGHSGDYVSDNAGKHTLNCASCAAVETEACDYDVTTVAATCTKDGYVQYKCKKCGYEKQEASGEEATGIHINEWITLDAPTCKEVGIAKEVCKNCGESSGKYKSIPSIDHTWGGLTVVTAPGCETEGISKHTCSECGTEEQVSVPALDHNWTDEGGYLDGDVWVQVCTRCDKVKRHELLGCTDNEHLSLTVIAAKEATCTQEGLTAGEKCEACGKITKKQETTPALGHDWDYENPTIEMEGTTLKLIYKCTRCEELLIEEY